MEAKDKAKELIHKFEDSLLSNIDWITWATAKACAIICVDEILNLDTVWYERRIAPTDESTIEFWQQVKEEIKNL